MNKFFTLVSVSLLVGCAADPNIVRPDLVTMERGGEFYQADSFKCEKIAETRDYSAEILSHAFGSALAAGVVGGLTGAAIGGVYGNAGTGAQVGMFSAVGAHSLSSINSGNTYDTATLIWARCMAAHGHNVYSIRAY